jgi:hypothetical protein
MINLLARHPRINNFHSRYSLLVCEFFQAQISERHFILSAWWHRCQRLRWRYFRWQRRCMGNERQATHSLCDCWSQRRPDRRLDSQEFATMVQHHQRQPGRCILQYQDQWQEQEHGWLGVSLAQILHHIPDANVPLAAH